uniref:C2H2-type domain-containing protein n=1 Tax=Macrostomum lignano TaxID=282301 RepID=A0A1I8HRL5_9PLAT
PPYCHGLLAASTACCDTGRPLDHVRTVHMLDTTVSTLSGSGAPREALLRQLQLLPQPPPKSSALQQASAATCPRCNHHSFDSAIAARPVSPKLPPPSQPERWLSEPAARTRPTLHCAHSSSELDGLRGATAAAESSQPIRLDSESTLYQQQHHQQSRSSSADDSGGGGEVGTFPASQELTPERQRLLISLSRSDGRESSHATLKTKTRNSQRLQARSVYKELVIPISLLRKPQ